MPLLNRSLALIVYAFGLNHGSIIHHTNGALCGSAQKIKPLITTKLLKLYIRDINAIFISPMRSQHFED